MSQSFQGRGTNPRSHHNKPKKPGIRTVLYLTEEDRKFLAQCGELKVGKLNMSRGVEWLIEQVKTKQGET